MSGSREFKNRPSSGKDADLSAPSGVRSKSLSVAPEDCTANPYATSGMTPQQTPNGLSFFVNRADADIEKGLSGFYDDLTRGTTIQLNNKTLWFVKEGEEQPEGDVLIFSNKEQLRQILKKELLGQYRNFMRHYTQGPGAAIAGRCAVFLAENNFQFDPGQLNSVIQNEVIDPRLNKPCDKIFNLNCVDGVLSFETIEPVFFNQLPGFANTDLRKCQVKTTGILTPEGFKITWETGQPFILNVLRGKTASLAAFTNKQDQPVLEVSRPVIDKPVQSTPSTWFRFKEKCNNAWQKWKAIPTSRKLLAGGFLLLGGAAIVAGALFCPPSLALTLPIVGKVNAALSFLYGGIGLASLVVVGHMADTMTTSVPAPAPAVKKDQAALPAPGLRQSSSQTASGLGISRRASLAPERPHTHEQKRDDEDRAQAQLPGNLPKSRTFIGQKHEPTQPVPIPQPNKRRFSLPTPGSQ